MTSIVYRCPDKFLALVLTLFLALLVLLILSPRSKAETTLHIWSSTDEQAMGTFLPRFRESYPGIRVIYREFNTNELYQAFIDASANPGSTQQPDIVISPAMDLQVSLVNAGLAYSFNPPNAKNLPQWVQWRNELYGFTFEPAAVVYNKKAFENIPMPETHTDLSNLVRDRPDIFEGKIGTYDIRKSGIGYFFATQDAIQNNQTSRLIESFGRARVKLFCCSKDIIEQVESGKLNLGYNVIGSYAFAAAQSSRDIGVYFPRDYTIFMSRTAFIPKSAKEKKAAEIFVNYLLSSEGQDALAQYSDLLPLRPNSISTRVGQLHDIPIFKVKLGIGLLAFQDRLKKQHFLENWESSAKWEGPHTPFASANQGKSP